MKRNFYLTLACLIILCICTTSMLGVASGLNRDDSSAFGDYIGKNELRTVGQPKVYVLGRQLFLYETQDFDAKPSLTLCEGEFAELLASQDSKLFVRHAEGLSNGEVIYIDGWIDERFVIISNQYYVAMHPTPVYSDITTDAKIIRMMDTYDSLIVIDERNGFYSVMINGAVGYVEME